MKTLRGSHSEATGVETGASFIKRSQVNTGTILILAALIITSDHGVGWARRQVDRIRMGRSRCSTLRPGKPVTWGRTAAEVRRKI